MSDNNADLGAFLAGFVIGGLVGAATALILAPQSGQETRSQITSKSRELQRTGEEQVRHYRELADSYSKEYRDKVGDAVSDARDRLEETGGQVQEQARIVLDAGKERVSQAREQVETTVQQEGKESQPTEGDTPPTS
jgi:gas vesicle protein